jgi:hypothetical protein
LPEAFAIRDSPSAAHLVPLALAERICLTFDRVDPARVHGSFDCFQTPGTFDEFLRSTPPIQQITNSRFAREGRSLHAPDRAVRRHCCASDPWRATPSIRTNRPSSRRLSSQYRGAEMETANFSSSGPSRRIISLASAMVMSGIGYANCPASPALRRFCGD